MEGLYYENSYYFMRDSFTLQLYLHIGWLLAFTTEANARLPLTFFLKCIIELGPWKRFKATSSECWNICSKDGALRELCSLTWKGFFFFFCNLHLAFSTKHIFMLLFLFLRCSKSHWTVQWSAVLSLTFICWFWNWNFLLMHWLWSI